VAGCRRRPSAGGNGPAGGRALMPPYLP
jgi:hypothetical protein